MHEMGLCEAIVEAALQRAGGRRVSAVRVRVGGHPVDPQVVDQGFRLAAAGTLAEDAELDLVVEPPTVRCRSCGADSPVTTATALVACPRCGGLDVDATGGDDLVVESIATTDHATTDHATTDHATTDHATTDHEPAPARGGGA